MTSSSGPTTEPRAAMYALPALSAAIRHGFVDPIGRIAWARADTPGVAQILAAHGFAIVRVELWCLCWGNTYSSIVPFIEDRAGMVSWRLESGWTPETEPWDGFCNRCLAAALPSLTDNSYEALLTPEYGPEKMRTYIEAVNETEYWAG